MEYQQSDSYLRDLQTAIQQGEQRLGRTYDALLSAYEARGGDTLTADDARLLARSTSFMGLESDRKDDVARVLDEYVGDTEVRRRHGTPTSWRELEEYLTYAALIEDTERRETIAKQGVRRALQHMVPY